MSGTILSLIITDAGRAALVNAEHTGTDPVVITAIALGSGLWSPTPGATRLKSEIKRVSTFGGMAVSSDTIHVTIQDDSTAAYSLGEFGLYTDTGILFAIHSGSSVILEKSSAGILLLSADIVLTGDDAANIVIQGDGFSLPPASETVAGVVELATQSEVNAGSDNRRAIVPARLRAWWDSVRHWKNIEGKPEVFPIAQATEAELGGLKIATPSEVTDGKIHTEAVTPKTLRGELDRWGVTHARNCGNFSMIATSGVFTAIPGPSGMVIITVNFHTWAAYSHGSHPKLTVTCGRVTHTAQSAMTEYDGRLTGATLAVTMPIHLSVPTTVNWSVDGAISGNNVNGGWVGI